MDVIEGVRAAIKEMMLPELDRIREENKGIKAIRFKTSRNKAAYAYMLTLRWSPRNMK